MTQSPALAEARRLSVPLCDLGLAPENLRFAEPPDEDVPRLADTLAAAGLIYPLLVRSGRAGEARYMVLDGRRRRFALLLRAERGEIAADTPVDCLLAEGKARQAAAALLPNREHAPVHIADVIAAIGRMRAAKMAAAAIACALGYDAAEVRRLSVLARVHPDALTAFRAGKLTLKQLRLLARLPDRDRQAEFAAMADGGYFPAWQLEAAVRGDRVTVEDARLRLVGTAAYAEAGGRLDSDLFGELPDVILDPELLERLSRGRAVAAARLLAEAGLAVHLAAEGEWRAPEGLETLPWTHVGSLPEAQRAAFAAAQAEAELAAGRLKADPGEAAEADLAAWLQAQLALARARRPDDDLCAVLLMPDRDHGLDVTVLRRPPPVAADLIGDGGEAEDAAPWSPEPADIAQPEVQVETAGIGHALHAARTDIATRGLVRALADDPAAALIALTAELFKRLALHDPVTRDDSALMVAAQAYGGPGGETVEALDGEVRRRLAARRTAYLESGLRPITWVAGLAEDDRGALLAELVALSLDLREPRTSLIRASARAEAAEIAGLCGADLTAWWTPDAAFLARHGKPQLLAMLAQMGVSDPGAGKLRKAELVARVAAEAAARRWAPSEVQWSRPEPQGAPGDGGEASEAKSASDPEPVAAAAA